MSKIDGKKLNLEVLVSAVFTLIVEGGVVFHTQTNVLIYTTQSTASQLLNSDKQTTEITFTTEK